MGTPNMGVLCYFAHIMPNAILSMSQWNMLALGMSVSCLSPILFALLPNAGTVSGGILARRTIEN